MRAVILAVAFALVAVGCASGATAPSSASGSNTVVTQTADPTTTTTEVVLPEPPRYVPLAGEPAADAKQLAADTVQALTTYEAGTAAADVGRRLEALLVDPQIADAAAGLRADDSASVGEIVYPQLGGLTDTQASVMVVVRQRLLRNGEERSVTRTVDVRLARTNQTWNVTGVASIGGSPPDPPAALSPTASEVLAHPSIELPDSARWDIQRGGTDDRVLSLLLTMAAEHTLSVTVLASGHPPNVFDSASISNHTRGRGVDIWAVDGQPVLSQRDPAGPLHALSTELLTLGVTELGSPWDLDGPGGAAFTNTLHQDHLHLAFDN